MTIVDRSKTPNELVYLAPHVELVEENMKRFVKWFNESAADLQSPLLADASIAHLWFECIHPFSDGNGRVGRALVMKFVGQKLNVRPALALSVVIERARLQYYAAFKKVVNGLDVSSWVDYFSDVIENSLDMAETLVRLTYAKRDFYRRLAGKLNEDQKRALEEVFKANEACLAEVMDAQRYMRITGTASATATRHLNALAECGAFIRTGDYKGTQYRLNFPEFSHAKTNT